MKSAYFDFEFGFEPAAGFSQVRSILIEPVLMVAVAAFWLVALPFAAVFQACVKVSDALVTMKSGCAARPNPLLLRRSDDGKRALTLSSRNPVAVGNV